MPPLVFDHFVTKLATPVLYGKYLVVPNNAVKSETITAVLPVTLPFVSIVIFLKSPVFACVTVANVAATLPDPLAVTSPVSAVMPPVGNVAQV